jgi:hypothetical protein
MSSMRLVAFSRLCLLIGFFQLIPMTTAGAFGLREDGPIGISAGLSAESWRAIQRQLRPRQPVSPTIAGANPALTPATLRDANINGGDRFGYSVALSGDTLVVGAPFEDSGDTGINGNQGSNAAPGAGAAYVFVRTAGVWTQQAYLKASNTGAGDNFGFGVALSGDTLVVGAPGEAGGATGVNGNQGDNSAPGAGAAYVFVRTAGVWTQQAYLKASNTGAGDNLGFGVALSGDTLVVGAPGEAGGATGVNGNQLDNGAPGAGAAYVFVRTAGNWTQQAYLKASNTDAGDRFGWSVALSGDTLAVGAIGEASSATGVNGDPGNNSASLAGAAFVFVRSGGVWTQQAYLKASNTDAGDLFGWSAALAGDTLVIGAIGETSKSTGVNGDQRDDSAPGAGAAYAFVRSGGVWTQQAYLKASNAGAVNGFGHSVSLSGETLVIGAPAEASAATGVNGNQGDNSAPGAGAAYVFGRTVGVWVQQAYLKASNTGAGDRFGWLAALDGDTALMGATGEASKDTGVNGNQGDNSAPGAGAAYVFVRSGGFWAQQAYLKASNTGGADRFGVFLPLVFK